MKVKQKLCKGTGKAKGFNSCGEIKYIHRYGLCTSCFRDWLLSTPEGKETLLKATIKASSDRISLEKEVKQITEHKKITSLTASLVTLVHEYIRLRDKFKPCISCGTHWNDHFQAGHYHKAELYPSIKFNEFNINGQCRKCNTRLDGNFDGYTTNLPNRIGLEEFNGLEILAELEKKIPFKWDRESLKETREYYRKKLSDLKRTI